MPEKIIRPGQNSLKPARAKLFNKQERKKMNLQEIRNSLNERGYQLDIVHLRQHPVLGQEDVGFELKTKSQILSEYGNMGLVCQNGGETRVQIGKDGQIVATGVAVCGKKDGFNRKIGLTVAMGRALRELAEKTTE
jgi:hypothetical protein